MGVITKTIKKAIIFVDIDDDEIPRYTYKEPHFDAARKMGLLCITAAINGRAHKNRLYNNSDLVVWFDQLEVVSLLNLIHNLQSQYQICAIFSYTGQASIHGQAGCVIAKVCEQLDLRHPTIEAINFCNNKFMMREVLLSNNIKSIRYSICNDIDMLRNSSRLIGYPLIAKPPFGAGSAFIKKCENWEQLEQHYFDFMAQYQNTVALNFYGNEHTFLSLKGEEYNYIPGKSILLESYIDGIEASVECVITDNEIHTVMIHEKLILEEKSNTILENLLITPPVSFSNNQKEEIFKYTKTCLQAIGLKNAIVHFEFRMTNEGPIVIEINPRLGGLYVNSGFRDLAELDPYSTYLKVLQGDEYIDLELKKSSQKAKIKKDNYSMMTFYPQKSGFLIDIEGLSCIETNPDVIDFARHPLNTYVDANLEEHYLFKCWLRVNGKEQAERSYKKYLSGFNPIILS